MNTETGQSAYDLYMSKNIAQSSEPRAGVRCSFFYKSAIVNNWETNVIKQVSVPKMLAAWDRSVRRTESFIKGRTDHMFIENSFRGHFNMSKTYGKAKKIVLIY